MEETEVKEALRKGINYYLSLQKDNGSWSGDFGGCTFLLPFFVALYYISGEPLLHEEKSGIIEYFLNSMNKDGSVGLYPGDDGNVYMTVASYTSLRLLGLDKNHSDLCSMKKWFDERGGPLSAATWGKFFLCLLNCYDYDGLNPILPEVWLLPRKNPFHPGKIRAHVRQCHLPMAYCYGVKFQMPKNELIKALRKELYQQKYSTIHFKKFRNTISSTDCVVPHHWVLKVSNRIMTWYERLHSKKLRKKSLNFIYDHICYEDRVTHYINLGPVNSALNTLVHFIKGEKKAFQSSIREVNKYLSKDELGIKMNGTNSTATWDTVFSIQALLESPFKNELKGPIQKAFHFVKENQIDTELPDADKYFRQHRLGGWPLSNKEQGWAISDCTAEGYKSVTLCSSFLNEDIDENLMKHAILFILSVQNKDGGIAAYEKKRTGNYIDMLNGSDLWGNLLAGRPYVECTSACLQALALVDEADYIDNNLKQDVKDAMNRGVNYIKNIAREDGSFYGYWGVCFTYGTWFAIWGLLAADVSKEDPVIENACQFLIQKQNNDGGWGEHYNACKQEIWIDYDSQVEQTAWALLTLIKAGKANSPNVKRGVDFLIKKQLSSGDWPRGLMMGVFNKTTMIHYEHYRRYFPIWALSLYYTFTKEIDNVC